MPTPLRCEPEQRHRSFPYHWVQWRSDRRADDPQPWTWDNNQTQWHSCSGVAYTPEQAAERNWCYLSPAYFPTHDDAEQEEIIRHLGAILTAHYYSVRYDKPLDHPLVRLATEARKIVGSEQAEMVITNLAMLGFSIRRFDV